jgi:hypothetical protein
MRLNAATDKANLPVKPRRPSVASTCEYCDASVSTARLFRFCRRADHGRTTDVDVLDQYINRARTSRSDLQATPRPTVATFSRTWRQQQWTGNWDVHPSRYITGHAVRRHRRWISRRPAESPGQLIIPGNGDRGRLCRIKIRIICYSRQQHGRFGSVDQLVLDQFFAAGVVVQFPSYLAASNMTRLHHHFQQRLTTRTIMS